MSVIDEYHNIYIYTHTDIHLSKLNSRNQRGGASHEVRVDIPELHMHLPIVLLP